MNWKAKLFMLDNGKMVKGTNNCSILKFLIEKLKNFDRCGKGK